MKSYPWKLGIDVQPHLMTAIAVSYSAKTAQFQQYWQTDLPHRSTHFGQITDLSFLVSQFQSLFHSLPSKTKCRIALSPSSILQGEVKAPANLPNQQEKTYYIYSTLNRLFPVPATELMIDFYETAPLHYLVTAAKKSVILQWQTAFKQANLCLDGIDITPCAIRHLAQNLHIDNNTVLLYFIDEQWLVISPCGTPFHYDFVDDSQLATVLKRYPHATHCLTNQTHPTIYLATQYWQPFDALTIDLSPLTLPDNPHQFTIAAGLALRQHYDLR